MGKGGRGVHSEGVYRGYIRPLVLANGGGAYAPFASFLCVNLILFSVGCFFFPSRFCHLLFPHLFNN